MSMTKECYDSHLLENTGTNQSGRPLNALGATYAMVDERKLPDLILFIKNYSAFINYYDLSNRLAGSWEIFMEKDPAVATSVIASLNTNDYSNYVGNLYDYIISPTSPWVIPSYPDAAQTFKYIFDLIASVANIINQALPNIPADTDYQQFLTVTIGSKLAVPLNLLADYFNYLKTALPPHSPLSPPAAAYDPGSPVGNLASIDALDFISYGPWTYPIPVPNPLYSIYFNSGSGPSVYQQIIADPIFTGTVDSFLDGVAYLADQTRSVYLEKMISSYPEHTPHYALFLSFLRLFENAQDHLNDYTRRHLKFYYKKVLRLNNSAGIPDHVHIGFTLQKNTIQHKLSSGTRLKAGKNAANKDLFYALTRDIILNQSVVQELKSLFLVKKADSAGNIGQMLYASPTANSADGQGAKLITTDQSWFPFGDLGNNDFRANPATIGFAIASHLLYLNEGSRTITLTFSVGLPAAVSPSSFAISADSFSVQFTGNKKWYDAQDPNYTAGVNYSFSSSPAQIILQISINGTAPPIVPYSKKIHGGNYPQSLPMLKIVLTESGFSNYAVLKFMTISSVSITVDVNNVQNLLLQNQDGKIDDSKPFKPFGQFPVSEAPFIIGSKEIFQKPLNAVSLSINWQTSPAPADSVYLQFLSEGQWNPDPVSISTNLPNPNLNALMGTHPTALIPYPDFTDNKPFTAGSVNGFIRLLLNSSAYDLQTYLNTVQNAAAANTVTITPNPADSPPPTSVTFQLQAPAGSVPPVPPAPVANAISMDYTSSVSFLSDTASSKMDYDSRQHFFYHVEPFGFRELHPWLMNLPKENDSSLEDNQVNFLPVFTLDNLKGSTADDGTTISPDNGGELWIGLQNAIPGETHSILFEVSEGSSNPLKDTTIVSWYYMSFNNWISLENQIVDQTNNLSQSGLVILPLFGDETLNNTRADSGMVWIKAVVQNNTDAVCRVIAVIPNAAEAVFVQDIPNGIHFTTNIAGSVISKLAVPDGAVKQVSQSYPSYGGAPAETNDQFNLRVSERLRHKHRAVTIWDYERLVLQNFSQIHKVKCLNHTFIDTTPPGAYSELKPGHVLLVTIPSFELVSNANPYLPFTNKGLLTQIRLFLLTLCSPFVNVHVENPKFEGIQVDFKVSFTKGSDINFYTGQLNTDIMNFLMPWATGSETKDLNFGGSIEKSAILNFIQSRDYVDYVTCFKMNQYIYGQTGFTIYQTNIDIAVATSARSIFVPYYVPGTPALGNNIIPTSDCNCNG